MRIEVARAVDRLDAPLSVHLVDFPPRSEVTLNARVDEPGGRVWSASLALRTGDGGALEVDGDALIAAMEPAGPVGSSFDESGVAPLSIPLEAGGGPPTRGREF